MSIKFPSLNEIIKFMFSKIAIIIAKGDKFKEWNAKIRVEKSSFFKEIAIECKAAEHP